MRDFQRQTGLPGSSWPYERDQTYGGISEPVPQCLQVSITAEKSRQRKGQRDATEFIDCRVRQQAPAHSVAARHESYRQVKSRGQRPHGFDMGPPSFPALQSADAMHRQARNRRELLLGVARSLAKCFQLCAK